MISAPSYAKRISSHEVRYHTEEISPVPSGRDIIAKRLFCLVDKRGALHGTLVGIRKHFFAGYFGAGIPTPNVCEKIKEFASVCTGSCTCPMACADSFRIPSFCAKKGHSDGCSAFWQFYKRKIPFSHTKSKPSTAEYRSCKRGVERPCGFDFERRSDGVKERRRFFEKENAVANDT